nr:SCO family protein [Thioalkalivibrio sp.]
MSRNLLWSAAALAALLLLAAGLFWPDARNSGDGQAAIGQPRTLSTPAQDAAKVQGSVGQPRALPADAQDPSEVHAAAVHHRPLPISAAPVGGPIVLPVSSRDGPLSLEDYRGQYVWIYFGYTACPDACPMTLALMSQALSRLPSEWQGRVRGLFVSVDPERDDAAHLGDYVGHFHADIDAATGPHEQLREIAARYGVFYQRTDVESALGYVVDHSSSTYLVGPDGALITTHPHGTSPAELMQALLDQPAPP